jgi:hypothetical protein
MAACRRYSPSRGSQWTGARSSAAARSDCTWAFPRSPAGPPVTTPAGHDATGLISAHRMTGSLVSAKSINRTGGYPDPQCAPLPAGALRRHALKVGAQCGNSACWDLCGVPTATMYDIAEAKCHGYAWNSSLFPGIRVFHSGLGLLNRSGMRALKMTAPLTRTAVTSSLAGLPVGSGVG